MGLHTAWLKYGREGQYSGYFAKPDRVQEPLATVVVIQEIWGVDAHIQDVARRFAQAGYAAFAPDLYARNGERKEALTAERIDAVKQFLNTVPPAAWHSAEEREAALAKLPGDEGKRIGETFSTLFGGVNPDLYIDQLLAATDFLRNVSEDTKGQGVVSVGFCMGGGLSARLAAADSHLKGAVIFYGHRPAKSFVETIQCPVRGFYGALDGKITEDVPGLAEDMKAAGKDFVSVVYENAHHAFFNDTRPAYNVRASRDAFARTLTFFAEQLE